MIVLAIILLALALAEVYAAGRHHSRMLAADSRYSRIYNQQERDNDLGVAAIFAGVGICALIVAVLR